MEINSRTAKQSHLRRKPVGDLTEENQRRLRSSTSLRKKIIEKFGQKIHQGNEQKTRRRQHQVVSITLKNSQPNETGKDSPHRQRRSFLQCRLPQRSSTTWNCPTEKPSRNHTTESQATNLHHRRHRRFFMQVGVQKKDRKFLRFLWNEDFNKPPNEFGYQRHLFRPRDSTA